MLKTSRIAVVKAITQVRYARTSDVAILVSRYIKKLNVNEIFWRVKIKPGKPLFFGKKRNVYIFGLPGNPASTFINTFIFLVPALKKMIGSQNYCNKYVEAELLEGFAKTGDRKEFLRAKYIVKNDRCFVSVFSKQGSHILSSLANSNCIIETDYNDRTYKAGEKVRIYPL